MVIKNFKKKTYTIINPKKEKISISKRLGFYFSKIDKKDKKIVNFYLLNDFKK